MRWNQQRREQASQSSLPYAHSTNGLLRDVHGVILRREEGGRRQVARRIKGGNKKERDRSSQ